jgi:hypothetical protein
MPLIPRVPYALLLKVVLGNLQGRLIRSLCIARVRIVVITILVDEPEVYLDLTTIIQSPSFLFEPFPNISSSSRSVLCCSIAALHPVTFVDGHEGLFIRRC